MVETTTNNFGEEVDNTDSDSQTSYSYMAFHNDKIIGFFDNLPEAKDAVNGYQMDNNIDINDTLEVRKVL